MNLLIACMIALAMLGSEEANKQKNGKREEEPCPCGEICVQAVQKCGMTHCKGKEVPPTEQPKKAAEKEKAES